MPIVPQIAQLILKQKVEFIAESKAGTCAGFKGSDYPDHFIKLHRLNVGLRKWHSVMNSAINQDPESL